MEILRIRGRRAGPEVLDRAAAVAAAGGLLIYPTDTLYALGGRALEPSVAERVRVVKGREPDKPLPLVAGDPAEARSLCLDWPESAARLAASFWPGPLALVLSAAPVVPEAVTAGSGTIAVRVPAADITRSLCARCGPLISTSANRAGGVAPATCEQAVIAVGDAVALAIDAGPGGAVASTIVDLTAASPRLLREGAVAWEGIRRVLGLR
jgi:L-threonylcarbamoyladenylate synthase